jgi:hypothetical protein
LSILFPNWSWIPQSFSLTHDQSQVEKYKTYSSCKQETICFIGKVHMPETIEILNTTKFVRIEYRQQIHSFAMSVYSQCQQSNAHSVNAITCCSDTIKLLSPDKNLGIEEHCQYSLPASRRCKWTETRQIELPFGDVAFVSPSYPLDQPAP